MSMLSILARSLLEDASADLSYRDKAYEFVVKLKAWLANPDNEDHLEYVGGKFDGGVAFKAKFVDADYDDLMIVMLPHASKQTGEYQVSGGFGKTPDSRWSVIFIYNLIGPCNTKYADTRIDVGTLIHEVIHYFDAKREKKPQKASRAKIDSGDDVGYFNDPSEFNAYFQEMAWSLGRLFENEHFSALPEHRTWAGFVELAEKIAQTQWVELLTPKYRRKFLKRLHPLWLRLVGTGT